jgi:DNA primase
MTLEELVEESHKTLQNSKSPMLYLQKDRGLTVDTINREKIGYCNARIDKLFNADYHAKRSQKLRAFIKNRVILPIRDDCGKIVGVSSRYPSSKVHSGWCNSRFPKENVVYNLNQARQAAFEKDKLYIVEGYMDALMLYQCGLKNVVALMGVSMSNKAMGLILRYTSNICLCFDTDPEKDGKMGAGQKALYWFSKNIQSGRIVVFDNVTAIKMPLGVDPDEYVIEHSLDDFLKLETYL